MTTQLNLFAARAKRDASISKVASKNPVQIRKAIELIRFLAPKLADFTTDDLFPCPSEAGFTDPRAIGAIMRKAQRLGLIIPTDRVRNSSQTSCHSRPKRVWINA